MRILIVHTRYLQAGGEDAVVRDEAALLAAHGHEVSLCLYDNADLLPMVQARRALATVWNHDLATTLRQRVRDTRADIVHVHNSFAVASPAVLWAASEGGAAVVQTLHNFRLFCIQATLQRAGQHCEKCLGRGPWAGLLYGCYRNSRAASAVAAASILVHRTLGTWRTRVDRFIALNDFCARLFVAAGLPGERIAVKPNFIDMPPPPDAPRAGGLYVGRLAEEKGVRVLARAATADLQVAVLGSGPLADTLRGTPGLHLHGAASAEQVRQRMCAASWLVLPSIWVECFPRVLVEAYAAGLPVIASRVGALAELVEEGVTGLLFAPGEAGDLRRVMQWAERHPDAMRRMGQRARGVYERRYAGESNHARLLEIYAAALTRRDTLRPLRTARAGLR